MLKKHVHLHAFIVLMLACVLMQGCSSTPASEAGSTQAETTAVEQVQTQSESQDTDSQEQTESNAKTAQAPVEESTATTLDVASIPAYSGSPYVRVLDNVPQFTETNKARGSFEEYSSLDSLGRCGVAFALIGTDTMPTEKRGSIGMIKPSGWHTVRYDDLVDGKYLYNRCHLIGYQLAGENANEKNLITGTRYLNVTGMLPFEDEVADYVKRTSNHVLYRVTPIFEGNNLVASGVQMEAWSVEDGGSGVSFDVYCYNVQPGVTIDYATGESWRTEEQSSNTGTSQEQAAQSKNAATASGTSNTEATSTQSTTKSYVLNTNTKKFHLPGCRYTSTIKANNREDFTGTRDELLNRGFEPCKVCNP